MKVLGTYTHIPLNFWKKAEEIIGEKIPRNEFRIICKCRGIKDANNKCSSSGLFPTTFRPKYTSETANKEELFLSEKEDIWIALSQGNPRKYISISQLL